MTPAILLLVMLMPAALVESTAPCNCVNATLPNILDLGGCLGTSLDFSTATVADIVAALVKLVQCLVNALLNLNVSGAVAALLEIIQLVLNLLGLNILNLTAAIKPLCCQSNVSGCKTIFTGTETCKTPIDISLPGNLGLEKCFADPLLQATQGDPCTDDLLVALIKALACLLQILLGSDPGSLLSGLACVVVTLLQGVSATAGLVLKLACIALVASIKLTVNCG